MDQHNSEVGGWGSWNKGRRREDTSSWNRYCERAAIRAHNNQHNREIKDEGVRY
jgi:hypothetical protein